MIIQINKTKQSALDLTRCELRLCGDSIIADTTDRRTVKRLTFQNSDNAKDALCAIWFASEHGSKTLEITETSTSIRFKC